MFSVKLQLNPSSVRDGGEVLKGNHLLPTGSLMAIAAVVYQLTNWRGCPRSVLCRACCFAHLVWQIASLWRMQGLGAVLTYDISFVSDKWPFSGGAWFTWEAIARYESPSSVTSKKKPWPSKTWPEIVALLVALATLCQAALGVIIRSDHYGSCIHFPYWLILWHQARKVSFCSKKFVEILCSMKESLSLQKNWRKWWH